MTDKEVYAILDYLKKYGRTNTFRLARHLRIERHKLLDILKTLKEKKAIEFKGGTVELIKLPQKEEKVAEEKPSELKIPRIEKIPKTKVKPKKIKHRKRKPKEIKHKKREVSKISENLQEENKNLKEELSGLKEEISGLTEKFNAKKHLLDSSEKKMEELKSEIQGLEQKASIPPKIIERTIIKKIPVKKIIRITRIKRIPVVVKEKPKKFGFRLPTINVPKITMPKIKIDFKKIKKGLRPDVGQLQQKMTGSSKTIKKWWSKRKKEEEWLKRKERKLKNKIKKEIKSIHLPKITKKD